jgi:hypothetical protein
MTSQEMRSWLELCHEAVVERDPGRLLGLFLKIDRIFTEKQLKQVPSPGQGPAQSPEA